MSLPPRASKQLAAFQLHSGQERILHGDWAKPRANKQQPTKSKRQPHPKAASSAPPLIAAGDTPHTEGTANPVEEANKSEASASLGKVDQSIKKDIQVQKPSNKHGNTNEHTKQEPTRQELPDKVEKKDFRHGIAYEYSQRENCDPIKLAKFIQQERQRVFTYVKQNLFPPGRPSRKPDADDVSVCSCYIIDGLDPCGDHNCMNRLVCIECDPRFCPCGEKCTNQRFRRNQHARVMPFKTENKGWGLKTLEDLKPQQFVFEYCGEVINNEVCRQRLEANPDEDNFYYITLDRSECIDASKVGNLARFMNHSCEPNCQTQKWVVNGELRIGLFAKHDILAGTELTFDYNFERFGSKKQRCYCSTTNCRGYLGAKPKHLEAELKQKNGKRKPVAQTGRVKRTKTSGDITLVEQNWGLPPPPKKARHNFVVDHAQYVTALLNPLETENTHVSKFLNPRVYLPRNVRLVRKMYGEYFKGCVASAMTNKTRKGKNTMKSPSISSSPPSEKAKIPSNADSISLGDSGSPLEVPSVKKEGPVPISARRRKRKVVVKHSPKISEVLKKLGVGDRMQPSNATASPSATAPPSATATPIVTDTITAFVQASNETVTL